MEINFSEYQCLEIQDITILDSKGTKWSLSTSLMNSVYAEFNFTANRQTFVLYSTYQRSAGQYRSRDKYCGTGANCNAKRND